MTSPVFCFGLMVSVRITRCRHCRTLTILARGSIPTGTIAPVLAKV
ncbi:MAG: hypothetical protein WB986_00680 [Methanoregula sp.]